MPLRNPERAGIVAGSRFLRARAPLAPAALAQAAAGAALLLLAVPLARQGVRADAMSWALLQGLLAACIARGLGMQLWWLPMHALFVPGLLWALRFDLPPAYALYAFGLLASVYWGVARTRVPLFLSSRAATEALAALLPARRSFSFVDLGCGLGGVLFRLARARPGADYHGVEMAPIPFLLARLRARVGRHDCRVEWSDYARLDLGRYDVVYAYLSPAAMPGLWRKARREMRPGSLLISNSFAVPGVPAQHRVGVDAADGASLLIWRM